MKNQKKSRTVTPMVIFGIIFMICVLFLVKDYRDKKAAEEKFQELAQKAAVATETETEEMEIETETETEEPDRLQELGIEVPELGLDWDAFAEENEHIYAWIHLPDTKIDYPILQHPTETDYYLEHNLDHSKGLPGCIYTQIMNAKDFSDGNTVIYGHNMKNGTMFKGLHKFSEEEFFDANRYFYIYTPEKTFVYEIYAAVEFSNEHILYKYDFSAENAKTQFREDLKQCSGNIREDMQAAEDGNLVTLATCIGGKPNNRWLVVGVLLGEQETVKSQLESSKKVLNMIKS